LASRVTGSRDVPRSAAIAPIGVDPRDLHARREPQQIGDAIETRAFDVLMRDDVDSGRDVKGVLLLPRGRDYFDVQRVFQRSWLQ
jgi:hypothetical protein